jgi:hypothetical protein
MARNRKSESVVALAVLVNTSRDNLAKAADG